MITAGIDIGMENVKVVIMDGDRIIGRSKGLSGGAKRLAASEAALEGALKEAGLKKEAIQAIAATGKGKFDVTFADKCVTEPITTAKAAKYLCPEATTAVDAGADETIVVTFGKEKLVQEMALNEKCAAGVGIFLRTMARRLELTLDELSASVPKAVGGATVNDGCVVFAELDALSLLKQGTPPKEVASAIIDAAAVRVCMTINDITNTAMDCVVLFGGLAKNSAFIQALQAYTNTNFIIPEEAEYAGAIGAALAAAN